MSKRYIDDSFWTDPYVEQLDPTEKTVFIYLLTNPLCNVAGIYELSLKRLAYETGLDQSIANTILDRFVRDKKLLRIEDWVILLNFGKHQVLNPSVEAGVRRIWGELPDWVQTVAACDSLVYFTLLNLTKLNLNNTTNVVLADKPPETFGKPEINDVFEYWESKTGMAITAKAQANRRAANNLLKKHGTDKTKLLIDGVALALDDKYAPRIGDFCDLQSKLNDLLVWGRKRGMTNATAQF